MADDMTMQMAAQQPQPAPAEDPLAPDPAQVGAFITWWTDTISEARTFHKEAFKRMEEDSAFVRGLQYPGQTSLDDDRYVVNVAQSEVAASVATLYAKNPTFITKRRPRMDFAVWDETPEALQQAQLAMQMAMQAGMPVPPDAQALIADIMQGYQYRQNLDRVAKTLEVVFRQQIMQQQPDFKREMKQLIRRVETHGAGFLKLDFQRQMEVKPEDAQRIADISARLAHIDQLIAQVEKGETTEHEKEAEELRVALKTFNEQKYAIVREGLLVHFPRTQSIIIDKLCTQLRGFVGAGWIAEEFMLPASKIMEIYNKDVKGKGTAYGKAQGASFTDSWRPAPKQRGEKNKADDVYCVYEVYHRDTGSTFTICEGFDEYLREPAPLKLTLERFYPYYSLSFNDIEDETCIYPPSTVRLIRHPQREINRSKEGIRQHRIANKPHYVAAEGALSENDVKNMEEAPAHAVIQLQGLQPGQNAAEVFQQVPKQGIDPNLYETSTTAEDIRRITRRSDTRMGAVSNASATADTIAEDARQVEDKSKVDDIDDFLTDFARDAGATLLLHLSADTARKIAGPGAAWPEADFGSIIEDLQLDIQAGSSGRPNRAMEVATFQRLFPILVQTPGIRPDWLAKTSIKLADSNIDISEAYLEGLPSIMAMNAMAQTATGNPETDPTQQGGEGGDKSERPPPAGNEMTVSQGANEIPETATPNSILQ